MKYNTACISIKCGRWTNQGNVNTAVRNSFHRATLPDKCPVHLISAKPEFSVLRMTASAYLQFSGIKTKNGKFTFTVHLSGRKEMKFVPKGTLKKSASYVKEVKISFFVCDRMKTHQAI